MMRKSSASDSPKGQDATINYQAKPNGNTPAEQGQIRPLVMAKHLLLTLQISTANTPFARNGADSIFTQRMKAENSHRMLSASMTCTEISGNGVPTIGWMIIPLLPGMPALIKTKTASIASLAADHGMSHLNFVAARRGCEYYSPRQMSLWGLGWLVRLLKIDRISKM